MGSEDVSENGLLSAVLPVLEEPWYGYCKVYDKTHNLARELVGLDGESLEHADEALGIFSYSCNYYAHYPGTLPCNYAPVISFAEKTFGNLEGRKIVEVGPGNTGVIPLAYFASKGAKTAGLDCEQPSPEAEKFAREHGVDFILGKWEDMGLYFPLDSVDLIYVKFMLPNPEAVNNFSKPSHEYAGKISSEMRKVLKNHGFFVLNSNSSWDTPPEYEPDPNVFADNGYSYHDFRILTCHGERFYVFQRDDNPSQPRDFYY